ncbi:MAG: hypothetical protein ACRDQE_07060 [Gaiellales bacterium]
MAVVPRLCDELPHDRRHLAHHGLFRRMRYADQNVMRLNILLLMVVSFPPFPTRLVAEAVRDAHAERPAVMLYGFTLLATPKIGFYVTATALAWLVPTVTVVLYLMIGASLVLRAPGEERSTAVA